MGRYSAPLAFGATFIVFKIVNGIKSMRVSKEVEQQVWTCPSSVFKAIAEDAVHASEF